MTDLHVALITPWQRRGGISTYSERFVEALETRDVTVSVVPIQNPNRANPLAFRSLVEDVPADTDIIHVQFEAGIFGTLGMTGVGAPAFFRKLEAIEAAPVVITLHEVHRVHDHRGYLGDRLLRMRDFVIERLALRAADATIVHTEEAVRILEQRHGTDPRIERMLHPTDADVEPVPSAEAKSTLGIEESVALTFGFVEHKKRYEDVVRVLPEFPSLDYVIAGGLRDGEGEEVLRSVREIATEVGVSDRLHHLGFVPDDRIPTVFSAADVVILPYERVSQSGAVNDALAYRRPVIASSLPAFEELRSEFGCLLTYEDNDGLKTALRDVLETQTTRRQLTQAAKCYVESVSWSSFADASVDLYQTLHDQL